MPAGVITMSNDDNRNEASEEQEMSEQNEQISAADEISEDQDTSQGASQALMAQGHESQAAAVTSPRPPTSPKTHHLLKHQLPEKDVSQHFGTSDQKAIGKIITKMGQRELQAKFREVFETPTYSNNNNWLRRKLMEAAGLPAPRVQQKVRRAGKPAKSQKKPKKPSSPGAGPGVAKRKPQPSIKAQKTVCHTPEKRRSLRQMAKAQDGTLVWAKLKGHGYWPAQVMDPCTVLALEQPLHPDSCVLVRFMEVESHAWVQQADVLDLEQHWDLLSFSNSAPEFQAALATAKRMMQSSSRADNHNKSPHITHNTARDQKYQVTETHQVTIHREPAMQTFSHESTGDMLATNHMSHFCESLLISNDNTGDSHIGSFLDDHDTQDLLIQDHHHDAMPAFFQSSIGSMGMLM